MVSGEIRLLFLHIFGLSGQRMWDFQAFSYFLCGTVTISILRYCYHKVFRTCEPLLMLGNNRYGYSLTPSSQRKSLDRMNSCRAELNSPILAFNSVLLSFWTPLQWIYFGEHLILSLHLKWSVSVADGSCRWWSGQFPRQKEVLRQRNLRITNLHYASSTCIGTLEGQALRSNSDF